MIKTKKAMNNLFDKFKKQRHRPAPQEPEPTHERTIPPHIVACRVCGGKGETDGTVCPQCQGSGRVARSKDFCNGIRAGNQSKIIKYESI